MQQSYGIYKNARNAAWQALIDFNITSLPVDVVDIATRSGIAIVKNSDANILKENQSAVSMYANDSWIIIYDNTMVIGRIRFTIAHELGHIFLGHALTNGLHARTFDLSKPELERQADIFASPLLAPACVLWGLDLQSTAKIAEVCQISQQAAAIRAERMQELYRRNKFLLHPLERQVYKNFEAFIKKNSKRQYY